MSGNRERSVTYLTIVFEVCFVAEQKDRRTNGSPQDTNPLQQMKCVGKALQVTDRVSDDVRIRPSD